MPRKRARIAKEGPSQAVENEIQGATRDQGSATKAAEESEYHGGSGRGAGRSAPGAQSSAGGETDDDEQEERKTSQALAEAVWLVGQELDAYDDVWNGPLTWSFPHLLPRVRDELERSPGLKAFVFGVTEPQHFRLSAPRQEGEGAAAQEQEEEEEEEEEEESTSSRILPIPVMVVALTRGMLPALLGITSVQSSSERVVAMKNLKMGWCPWRGDERLARRRRRQRNGSGEVMEPADHRIHVLHCSQRDVPVEPEEVTHVQVQYLSRGGKQVDFVFDKEVDRTQFFIPELIEDYGLQEEEAADIKSALKQAFQVKRKQVASAFDATRARVAQLSEDERSALDNLRVLKMYPRNPRLPTHLKTTFVNRYYGHADELV